MRLPDPPLLLITDRRQARRPLADVVATAVEAGCRWVSLREKDLPAEEQARLVSELLPVVRRWNARLIIHGDPLLAKACSVDGVHLAAGSDPGKARAELGAEASIGLSIHAVVEAGQLDATTVDYAIAGPVFATASKPGYGPVLGCGGLAAIVRATAVPVVAIGGIDAASVAEVCAAGAAGIAIMGGVMRAADPGREMRELREALALHSIASA